MPTMKEGIRQQNRHHAQPAEHHRTTEKVDECHETPVVRPSRIDNWSRNRVFRLRERCLVGRARTAQNMIGRYTGV
jgi:hypothetical protein